MRGHEPSVAASSANRFYELLLQTTFSVPADKKPVRVSYNNGIGIPMYEIPSRITALPANLRGSTVGTATFRDLLRSRVPDEMLMLNLGFVTERILTPDEISWLAPFCN